MDLKESALLGPDAARHWYYRSKADVMLRYLRGIEARRVLDVGAGSGFFARHLLCHGRVDSAVCVDIGYDADRDEEVGGRQLSFRRQVGRDEADLVLLMDVLEHVDDDAALLAEYADKVPRGGHILVSVPAHAWLWSEHDLFLGHRRRYGLPQLERLVAMAGLDLRRSGYAFGLVLPIAAALRLAGRFSGRARAAPASQLRRHSAPVDGLLGMLCRAEVPLLPFNRLGGLSAFCLVQKRG